MVYSRIVRAVHGEALSLISPRLTTILLVFGDFNCLNIQSTGAGLLAKPKNAHIGNAIIVGGLGLQVLMFIGFIVCCLTWHVRFRRHLSETGARCETPWRSYVHMLYGTSLAILVRSLYRMVEFVMGQDSYLFVNEWPTYVLDAGLMLLVMAAFYIWYPDQLQPGPRSMIELTSQGTVSPDHGYSSMPAGNTSLETTERGRQDGGAKFLEP